MHRITTERKDGIYTTICGTTGKYMMENNTIIDCPWLSQLAIYPNDEARVGI